MSDWRQRAALSVAEVAELLSVSERTVRRMGMPTVQVGGRARIPTRAVLELLGEGHATAAQAAAAPKRSREARRQADRIRGSLAR